MVRLLSSKPPVPSTCVIRSKKGAILMASGGKKHYGLCRLWSCSRLDHIVQRAQPRARRIDQHCHVAGRVAVGSHQFVRLRNSRPRKYLAHAGIDAAVEHELVGRRGLLEMGEMRTLHAL